MTEAPTDDHISRFIRLFQGNMEVYGRTNLVQGAIGPNGKQEAKTWLEKAKPTTEVWTAHLNGEGGIGIVPLAEDNTCEWGAIDIDIYDGQVTLAAIAQRIEAEALPFVLCRSKSGGAHLYIFLTEPVPATDMVALLESYAAYLGYGTAEIYPKQTHIAASDSDARYGNWLNIPYDGPNTLRYATRDGNEGLTLPDFLDLAESRRVRFEDAVPRAAEETFPDGPPCLNLIFGQKPLDASNRNILLCNATVYLKRAFPSDWEEKLTKLNQTLVVPLPDKELDTIKRSYGKKDYRYQCKKHPLCAHCNPRSCKKATFGIQPNEVIGNRRSMTKINTDPPLWVMIVEDQQLTLTSDELFSFREFSKKCMENLNRIPRPMKSDEWLETVNTMIQNCTIIDVPKEMGPEGMFIDHLFAFLENYTEEDRDRIRLGQVFKDINSYYFRHQDLIEFLKRQNFKELANNRITQVIRQTFKAQKKYISFAKSGANCWVIPEELVRYPEEEVATPERQEAAF